jgi:putative ABC transport system permease protein
MGRDELLLRQGAALVLLGAIIGLACAAAVSRSMGGALYGVRPIDLPTFVGGSLLLIAVALVATYVPARRAATVDPLIALKDE